jgi:hypothetical protein
VQNNQAMQQLDLVRKIVSAASMLAQLTPTAVKDLREINDICQRVQMKIVQSGPQAEPQAPPA